MPNHGVCDYLQLDPIVMDAPSEHLTLSASRAVDSEGSTHAVTIGDQDGNGWTLTPKAALALAVGLVQAHTAIQLDRSEDGDEHREAYGLAGSVDEVGGNDCPVGSQRFPYPGEPTEHNVVLRRYDALFPAQSIPELVRLLLVAVESACTGVDEDEERAA